MTQTIPCPLPPAPDRVSQNFNFPSQIVSRRVVSSMVRFWVQEKESLQSSSVFPRKHKAENFSSLQLFLHEMLFTPVGMPHTFSPLQKKAHRILENNYSSLLWVSLLERLMLLFLCLGSQETSRAPKLLSCASSPSGDELSLSGSVHHFHKWTGIRPFLLMENRTPWCCCPQPSPPLLVYLMCAINWAEAAERDGGI